MPTASNLTVRAGAIGELPDTLRAAMAPLDVKEQQFVYEFAKDHNITNAALRAGYGNGNKPSAKVAGCRLMNDPKVLAAILVLLETRAIEANIEAARLLEEVAVVAYSSIDHYTIDDYGNVGLAPGAPHGSIRAVSKIKKKIRHETREDGTTTVTYETELALWNKVEALNLGMKHKGMFIERTVSLHTTLEDLIKAARGDAA